MHSRPVFVWALGAILAAAACDGDRYLVGRDPDRADGGGAAGGASSGGIGGSTSSATGGAAGASAGAAGGASGTSGSVPAGADGGTAAGGSSAGGSGDGGIATGGAAGSTVAGTGGSNGAGPDGSDICGITTNVGLPVSRPLAITPGAAADRVMTFLYGRRADDQTLARFSLAKTNLDVGTVARALIYEEPDIVAATVFKTWLDVDHVLSADAGSADLDVALTPVLRQSMVASTLKFVSDLLIGKDTSLHALLTAPQMYFDAPLGAFFNTAAPTAPNLYAITAIDVGQRAGILTQPSTLVGRTSFTARGGWVSKTFLCQALPPPPEQTPEPMTPLPNQTHRDAYEQTVNNVACTSCHNMADPSGYALDHFDGLGRFQLLDNGNPIDSHAVVTIPTGVATNVNGAVQLAETLSTSCHVQNCVSNSLLQQALGGPLRAGEQDAAWEVSRIFSGSGFSLPELLVAITESSPFLAATPQTMYTGPGL